MMLTSQKFCFCNRQSFTIRFFLTILQLLIAQHALAQVSESFTDGDFVNAPEWSGNQTSFIVENGELRLNAAAVPGSAFLSTPSNAVQSASWECLVRLGFNPSSTNRAQVYLLSDAQDLSGPLNGYFVMIGDTPDEISLYRQSGTTKTKIIDGMNARVNLSSVTVKIKVVRDDVGSWELFSDVGHSGTFVSEGIVSDQIWTSGSWFGVLCTYTATRSDDFYFDDFHITGTPVKDEIPPELEAFQTTSSQSIELKFSEQMNNTTAESLLNYTLSPGSQLPSMATLNEDEKTVTLFFDQPFPNASECVLSISNLEDIGGNMMPATERTFLYYEPVVASPQDIIISEIFADPEPSRGLPDVEYVELFNRSTKTFDLSSWTISDGSSNGQFAKQYFFPGEYLIVSSLNGADKFESLGKATGVSNFPSLNNSGDAIILKDASGIVIDAVLYSDGWFRDDEKKEGGYSLELIDPENICSIDGNWTASENSDGGTPGKQNSVFANKPDLIGPRIISVIPQSETELIVRFNEKLQNTPLLEQQFVLHPAREVSAVSFVDSLLTSAAITVAQPLGLATTYSLSAHDIYDCAGNLIQQSNAIAFGVPQPAVKNDILINEILFNPRPTGVDFVELYNASSKFINLKSVSIANGGTGLTLLSSDDRLLAPGEILVVTTNADVVIGHYPVSSNSLFCELSEMPSMNDDEGCVRVMSNSVVIDSLSYTNTMHSPFLKDDEGVSLERISITEETHARANWKSASSVSGFATPGFLNSNSRPETVINGEITVEPEAFSPLESPNDFVLVHYDFNSGGWIANVDVIDSYGRLIYTIANNELLGTSGFFRWDGNQTDGQKARVGYYMIRFEIFDATGVVRQFKKRVAIASRF